MPHPWTSQQIGELARSFQPVSVLAAAAELEIFDSMTGEPRAAREIAVALKADLRATTVLLDALAALGFVQKSVDGYSITADVVELLSRNGPHHLLATVQHQANCLRRWAELARVVKSGKPAERTASVRGEAGDTASFIGAMHDRAGLIADRLIHQLNPAGIHHFLDVGGGSGSWTIAFLRSNASAKATIFDLPQVIPLARARTRDAAVDTRVTFTPGDFLKDDLPHDVDFVWLSAIIHQNSREENRRLFNKAFAALVPGGRVGLRDMVMDDSRTAPLAGALFAVNMLVSTTGGGTFTFNEIREDLESAGFRNAEVKAKDQGMDSIVVAEKP